MEKNINPEAQEALHLIDWIKEHGGFEASIKVQEIKGRIKQQNFLGKGLMDGLKELKADIEKRYS